MPTINWSTKVISILQSELTFVGGIVYELDVDAFRLALKNIEDSDEGMGFPDTHRHNTQVTLSGVTYARTFEIINGYTVTFEDTGSHYTVRFTGANHNIADVTNYDAVNLIVGNSAGLIAVDTGGGGGLTAEQINWLRDLAKIHGLISGTPLVVTSTTRTAGDVAQTISDSGGVVTIAR